MRNEGSKRLLCRLCGRCPPGGVQPKSGLCLFHEAELRRLGTRVALIRGDGHAPRQSKLPGSRGA